MNEVTKALIDSANTWGNAGRRCLELANNAISNSCPVSTKDFMTQCAVAFENEFRLRRLAERREKQAEESEVETWTENRTQAMTVKQSRRVYTRVRGCAHRYAVVCSRQGTPDGLEARYQA